MKHKNLFLVLLLSMSLCSVASAMTQPPTTPEKVSDATSAIGNIQLQDMDYGQPTGWTIEDSDNDGNSWEITTYPGTTNNCYTSYSHGNGQALTPDNWIKTKTFTITASYHALLFYKVGTSDAVNGAEHYSVYVGTNGNFSTLLTSETLDTVGLQIRTIDLSAYAGQTIQIGFRHHGCSNQSALYLDSIAVSSDDINNIISFPNDAAFDLTFNETATQVLTIVDLDQTTLSATIVAPFSLSTDGIHFSDSVVIPDQTHQLYVRATATTASDCYTYMNLYSQGVRMAAVVTIGFYYRSSPAHFTSDFYDNMDTINESFHCWDAIDKNGDTSKFKWVSTEASGTKGYYNLSYAGTKINDDYLITPQFTIQAGDTLIVNYSQARNDVTNSFSIYAVDSAYAYRFEIEANKTLIGGPVTISSYYEDSIRIALDDYVGQTTRFAIHCNTITSCSMKINSLTLKGVEKSCSSPLSSDYVENFGPNNTPLQCWDVLDVNEDGFSFDYSTTGEGYYYDTNTSGSANDYLVSPILHINPNDSIHITYRKENNMSHPILSLFLVDPQYANTTDIGTNNYRLKSVFAVTQTTPTTQSFSLNGYAGHDLRLAIKCTSMANRAPVYITKVALTNYTVTDVEETMDEPKSEQLLYPNPVRDVLYFTEPAQRVMVYTTTGQLLYQTTLNETEQSVNVSFLPQGLYMVRLMSKESVSTHLIIKE